MFGFCIKARQNPLKRLFRYFSQPIVWALILIIVIFGIGSVIKAIVFAESNAAGSLVVTYSEGANYVNENIVGKNFNLSVTSGVIATIKLDAEFATGQNKKINIKVPTGIGIKTYSATDATPIIPGVTKVEIDNAYKDYILTSNLTAATSDTHVLDKNGNPVKFAPGAPWISQNISGYTKLNTSVDEDQRVYGGDIEYTFSDLATKIELVFSVFVDNLVLNHASTTEVLEAIQIKMSSSAGDITQDCNITAKDVQVFIMGNKAFNPGTAYWNVNASSEIPNRSEQFGIASGIDLYNSIASSTIGLSDKLTATITYPEGVYYDNKITIPFIGQTITTDSHTGPHDTVAVNEGVNGGGTIVIDLDKIKVAHANNSNTSYNITAYFRADTAVYNQANPEVKGLNIAYEYERNNQTTSGASNYTRTMIFPGSGRDMRITPRNHKFRDTDSEYGYAPFSYPLGSFAFYSALSYNDVKMRFEFSEGTGARTVTFPGSNIHDVVAITTKGRTINIANVLDAASLTQGVIISESDLDLMDDEYLISITATMNVAQGSYNYSYIGGNCVYWGHFLDGQTGEVKLSILDNATGEIEINGATGEPITGMSQTTLDWENSGSGYYITTVKPYQGDTVFYPNSTIEVTGIIQYQNYWSSTSDLINPTVIISLPKGINLDPTSVRIQSPNGDKGEEWLQPSQSKASSRQIIDGIEWTTYYYQTENPYDFVVRGNQPKGSAYTTLDSTVVFNAIVDNAVPNYNLSLKDILSYDLGRTAINATSGQSYVYPDIVNRSGKTTEDSVYNLAATGGNIQIKPLIGLNIDIGIKTKGMNQDFMTYNGTESSIAAIARDMPAEVKIYYESTSISDFKSGSAIYMPVPKKGLDYAKYFENLEVENPMAIDNNNGTFEYSTKLTSVPTLVGDDGTTWTTYFATNIVGSNPNNYTVGNAAWEPVAGRGTINWTRASDYTGDLGDVVMMKFVADGNITPGSKGECIYDLELNSTVDREPNATNYWRTYNLAVTDDNKTGIWNYSSIIAANADGISLAGQVFVDRNIDAVYDTPDTAYSNQIGQPGYTILLSRDDNTEPTRELILDSNGNFTNKAKLNDEEIDFFLKEGDYTLTVMRDEESKYVFSKKESADHSNKDKYYNDVKNDDINEEGTIATYKFTIDVAVLSRNNYTANIGVGLSELDLTVVYEWDGDIPEDVVLPIDENKYKSGDIVGIDQDFTNKTKIEIYKESCEEETCPENTEREILGTYYFSGWTVDENIDSDGRILNNAVIRGVWRYVPYVPDEPEILVPNTGDGIIETKTAVINISTIGVFVGVFVVIILPRLRHKKVGFKK